MALLKVSINYTVTQNKGRITLRGNLIIIVSVYVFLLNYFVQPLPLTECITNCCYRYFSIMYLLI